MDTKNTTEVIENTDLPQNTESKNQPNATVDDKKKETGAARFKKALVKTGEVSKKVFISVVDKAQDLSEQQQNKNYAARMKKYNPLFPEWYISSDFKLPNLIRTVDDAERKGIDVCEGAIGWIEKKKDVEVMYLYDEAIQFSNIKFVPAAVCDSIYYVDPHDRHRFINVDGFFSMTQEEKLAELQHIAYSLGASRYWVEMLETSKESKSYDASTGIGHPKAKGTVSNDMERSTDMRTKSVAEAVFAGARTPVEPKLCWYMHDKNVQNLIKMRCSDKPNGGIATYTIELNSSVAASMSRSTAVKIDKAVISMGAKCDFDKKSEEEHARKMYFKLEF